MPVAESQRESSQTSSGNVRVILYHKTPTSGKTCFLKFDDDAICALGDIPALSEILEPGEQANIDEVVMHPSVLLKEVAQRLGHPAEQLEVDTEYHERVDVAGDCLSVFLVRFTTLDPPAELAEQLNARFISITEARSLGPAELELLRRAYVVIMEG